MKICRVCGHSKPEQAFAKDARRKDGFCSRCRACRRQHYLADILTPRRLAQEYNRKNKKAVQSRNLAYYYRNRDDRSEKMANWYLANKTRVLENMRAFRAANPGYCARQQSKRRAAEIQATPMWADLSRMNEIYAVSNWMTENSGEPWHVDHIVPLRSKTVCGLHCEANLTILPATENMSKSNRYWPDMW